ncbi:RIP metalloprotease RseP [Denitromonas ohlonensis]|uniref:Zinc metalloprotease n=2 Tax=Denitromonas TaxID=139331 RepID=A0A558EIC0_9RHOO|nr:RIP metalloprotease RseP [Denitromonas ohlonensis]TVT48565.1 MAG: RIP metalloprotease RseP [Denitromonas halophila]TVO69415.1 RIP metalloprotease RseP [Denitromonas ohlonensis]TVO77515.1 RIP metalloprotease RseP [Denitromonas ohlonensis]TVT73141.1 MAG: RIP metalloprotease RseP [Denitromonas halophila]TVT74200.1 MAG: RIP metalloprotease RseP [Denitromonas halophila]
MSIFEYIIPFVVGLGLLILIHELGHYSVARWCDVKVLRFSVGFGRPLFKWRAGKDGTEWVLALFPLGGYVKMLDEREGEVAAAELPRAFTQQSVWRRFAIVAAGPLANLLLAVLLYWVVFVGGVDELRARVEVTSPESVAAQAGFSSGDEIIQVGDVPIRSWQDWRWRLLKAVLDEPTIDVVVVSADGVRVTRRLSLNGITIDEAKNDPVAQLGFRPYRPMIPPVVGDIVAGGAADRAGLRVGDRVVAIDQKRIEDWSDLVERVSAAPGQPMQFEWLRDGARSEGVLTPEPVDRDGKLVGRVGIMVAPLAEGREAMFVTVSHGPIEGLVKAVAQTWEMSTFSLAMIGRMVTGELSWKNLSGPVTIADYAGQSAKMGLDHYLKFLALISISLGVLNLLPIPVLDGGHLLYYVIEMLRGGPVPERVMEIGQQVGFALLVMLMAFAFYNDINRLISG